MTRPRTPASHRTLVVTAQAAKPDPALPDRPPRGLAWGNRAPLRGAPAARARCPGTRSPESASGDGCSARLTHRDLKPPRLGRILKQAS